MCSFYLLHALGLLRTNSLRTFLESYGFCGWSHLMVEGGKVVQEGSHVGMLRSHHVLPDGQRLLLERLGLLVLALVVVECCQVVEASSHMGMLRSQHVLPDG